MSTNLIIKEQPPFIRITLNRPEFGNSYDHTTAIELAKIFDDVSKRRDLQGVILEGNGSHFCTGADLHWMAKAIALSEEENIKDMEVIKRLYQKILSLPIPLIIMAKGKIRGGGLGLTACGDIVIAEEKTTFSLSEAKLGLIPGIITPILESKIGRSRLGELSLTAREFTTNEALSYGLIHHSIPDAKVEDVLHSTLSQLKENSHASLVKIKESLGPLYQEESFQKHLLFSAKMRSGEDFKERIKKFKRS